MGRVYDVAPKDGERSGADHAVFIAGRRINGVFRIEFDADTDEGFATVHAYFNIADGGKWEAVADMTGDEGLKVSFRHYVYIAPNDAIDQDAVHRNGFRHLP